MLKKKYLIFLKDRVGIKKIPPGPAKTRTNPPAGFRTRGETTYTPG